MYCHANDYTSTSQLTLPGGAVQVVNEYRAHKLFSEPYPFKAGDKLSLYWSTLEATPYITIEASFIITMNVS